ncbi:response regulator transcription factor [Lachnotalea sp. AF33-28]|jgi:two-component system response regulator YesN|uniref:response regulator transcription factor n=1 Tax=Lachnotalea sp. AF33-28 TaxID=2292046 RepID=UPI000E49EF8F|nr:response regulator [Lachnotalea sp. AF33-28]RHP36374.1 response regulator [Lachnotalea sp. AF33-28]
MYKLGIADDESRLLSGLCEYYPWAEMGFEIRVRAKNGFGILEYLQKESLDVVLTDISMPGMDGIRLAKELHHDRQEPVIVFLSGYADFQYAKQAIKYGVYEYILKPVKYQELLDVFQRIRVRLDLEHREEEDRGGSYYMSVVEKVNRYVLENLSCATLKGAAARVGLSASYLSALYKQYTGRNFSDFILESRMTCAGKMLDDGVLKTYQIAERLGYDDPKNFTRAFRSFYGTAPREYRSRKGAGGEDDQC